MTSQNLQKTINYASTLPMIVFIAGLLVLFFFSAELYGEGMLAMLITAILYIIMILIRKTDINPPTQFNIILENLATYLAFGITSIVFGIKFYAVEVELLLVLFVFFFAIATALTMARNWEYEPIDSTGMPIAFNGILFPLFYYIYKFYFQNPGSSIFLIYFLFAGVLTLTNYKFLNLNQTNLTQKNQAIKNQIEDEQIQNRIKQRQNKLNENQKSENTIKKKKTHGDLLEESNLEKIIKFFKNLTNKTDNFNTIKGMPTKQELNETLPHRKEKSNNEFETTNKAFNIKPKPKRKKKLFQKIVGFFYNKFGKDDFNTIKHMPSKKEIQEVLIKQQNNTQTEIKKEETKPQEQKIQNNQNEFDLVGGDNKISQQEIKEVFQVENNNKKNTKLQTNQNNEYEFDDEDFNQEIELPQKKETKTTNNLDEEYDFGEFENDYK